MTNLHPKVAAAGVSGAAATILVWAISLPGVEVPPEVAASFSTVLAFLGGYLKAAP